MSLELFHPSVRAWFEKRFETPTRTQREAWPIIKSGRHTLIAAPTGSGKTLAAFLAAIDGLVRQAFNGALFATDLEDRTQILYVSPLKALSNDIHKNLQLPLQGIRDELSQQGFGFLEMRTMVRTGDTPQGERQRMRRCPPHILVTTPESLYLLLSSDSGRHMLAPVHTLIVDEIHALAGNKRGAHLALSVERLQSLSEGPLTRIGLSATQHPIDTVARFLTGDQAQDCAIIDSGHVRERDLAIELPASPLEAVMSREVWEELFTRLIAFIEAHHTTLIFVNTRRLSERIAKALSEHLGEQAVTSHHGSLAREHRLDAEQRLKAGQLRALVATASLELGIDIGDVDLVCQIGSPRSINTLLQRVGRSGHAVGGLPKGRLFPTSRDELVECVALLDAVHRGELDRLRVPKGSLDVLAQQLVAELSCGERQEDELYAQFIRAWPYRTLRRAEFDAVVKMLAQGFSTRRGRRSAWLHRDAVNHRLRPRRGARLAALLNGGAIPDMFDFDVILQPEGTFIGTLNEDFAFESLPGDIFQLGNSSYRVLKTEQGRMHVEDAQGQPPNIPFWFGEAPGRSDELSRAVSRLRSEIAKYLGSPDCEAPEDWLQKRSHISAAAAGQVARYLQTAHAALGVLPTHETLVFERFFDEAGDQHLVIHSPYGSRLNRAWGLALRKRFCRKFNFELQAAALENNVILSLGSTHSFPLEEVAAYLKSATVCDLLTQALLDAPMFATHWRWNATIALAVRRNRNGRRVPAQLQRMDAEDLIAVIFPDQLACLENIAGNRDIPDHPLVQQAIDDCLHEVMDVTGLMALLRRIETGQVCIVTRDLNGPSPLSEEILTARPYAFLDDAPAEERRTQMVHARRFVVPEDAARLAELNPEAIARVITEAWPRVSTADELHDALLIMGFLTEQEGQKCGWHEFLQVLKQERRATVFLPDLPQDTPLAEGASATDFRSPQPAGLWVCAEHLGQLQAVFPGAFLQPPITPVETEPDLSRARALVELLRARLQGLGPVSADTLAGDLGIAVQEVNIALTTLETEGFVMRGRYTPECKHDEWCERGLLARIHHYTTKQLRDNTKPVSKAVFMHFLLRWHALEAVGSETRDLAKPEGAEALYRVIAQLEGFQIPAAAWESDILPLRLKDYQPQWLDGLCSSGRVMWVRLGGNGDARRDSPPAGDAMRLSLRQTKTPRGPAPVRSTPIALLGRSRLKLWQYRLTGQKASVSALSQRVLAVLDRHGALFVDEILAHAGLLQTQLEQALAELAASGLVSSDSFVGLRALLLPSQRRKPLRAPRRFNRARYGIEDAGRWFRLIRGRNIDNGDDKRGDRDTVHYLCSLLLLRYGVVFRALLEREGGIPSWRELLYCYRRMEARGEVRGGRFVEGFSGEQFALPEAVGTLRKLRREERSQELIAVSGADPLNLVGIVVSGPRVPALTGNRVLFRDGSAVAVSVAGSVQILKKTDEVSAWELRNALLCRQGEMLSALG